MRRQTHPARQLGRIQPVQPARNSAIGAQFYRSCKICNCICSNALESITRTVHLKENYKGDGLHGETSPQRRSRVTMMEIPVYFFP